MPTSSVLQRFRGFDDRRRETGSPAKLANGLIAGSFGGFGCIAHDFSGKDEKARSHSEFVKLTEAARKGDAKAQWEVGIAYSENPSTWEGVSRDCVEAVKWYRRAAEQGYVFTQNALGSCYSFGNGVPKCVTQVKWFQYVTPVHRTWPAARRRRGAGGDSRIQMPLAQ